MNSTSMSIQASLPHDIALKIASSLQVADLCSLGSCSQFWWELCGSDYIWESLCRERWPALSLEIEESSSFDNQTHEEWRVFYIRKHNEVAGKAAGVIEFVNRCLAFESIEVGHYLKAVRELDVMQFGFEDARTFFLKSKHNVLLNLIGLHYCIIWLGLPGECVMEVLSNCNISQRQVRVQWWKLGRWFYGFRLRDELHTRNVSLEDLATGKEEEVLGVLHRGAVHEVIRVQISAAKPAYTSWSFQSAQDPN
ncbi:uncharacterized protein LOC107817382 [Nicotiana tabacum]|uniref:Uncharacterized protein LOC107817382 n=2 Tax=Nicotiana TaxID=4085 RepID=A0A1S4CC10_TOBAC|nr:PREDICTED: uncharacterized protein LOC104229651 [Nicotiana sylvestris]XP_016498675.1 PREDICTED: uncharacterized protein LOC107817382 [Nicotiana tabacum]